MTTCCWPSCPSPRYGYLYLCQTHANKVWRYIQDEADVALREQQALARRAVLPDHERHGWVYYIQVGDRLKIGFAADLAARIRAYPPGSTVIAQKRGTMADEKAEHQRCTPWRVAGREWYELNDQTRAVAAEAQEQEFRRCAEERAAAPSPYQPPPRKTRRRPAE